MNKYPKYKYSTAYKIKLMTSLGVTDNHNTLWRLNAANDLVATYILDHKLFKKCLKLKKNNQKINAYEYMRRAEQDYLSGYRLNKDECIKPLNELLERLNNVPTP